MYNILCLQFEKISVFLLMVATVGLRRIWNFSRVQSLQIPVTGLKSGTFFSRYFHDTSGLSPSSRFSTRIWTEWFVHLHACHSAWLCAWAIVFWNSSPIHHTSQRSRHLSQSWTRIWHRLGCRRLAWDSRLSCFFDSCKWLWGWVLGWQKKVS